jgi:GTPase SAR1 family protein
VFLVCFAIISSSSFDNVKNKWWPEVQHHAPHIPTILVGTKGDLRDDEATTKSLAAKGLKMVTGEEATKRAKEMGAIKYLECSALTQDGYVPCTITILRYNMCFFNCSIAMYGVRSLKVVFDEAIRAALMKSQPKPTRKCIIL